MADPPPHHRGSSRARARRPRGLRRASQNFRRALAEDETSWLVALSALSILLMVASVAFDDWPLTTYVIPLVLASSVLSFGRLLILFIVVLLCLTASSLDAAENSRRCGCGRHRRDRVDRADHRRASATADQAGTRLGAR